MSSVMRVECTMKNCIFFHPCRDAGWCECSHPEKKFHVIEDVCPLYRVDWTKSNNQMEALRQRFGMGPKPAKTV